MLGTTEAKNSLGDLNNFLGRKIIGRNNIEKRTLGACPPMH